MFYPWKQRLAAWADSTKLRIDALGLVTMLGSEEINASVGRLVPSRYVEFLPLLGAFVVAGDRFRTKAPGFGLYDITAGFKTTELSSWLTRWVKAQDFHQIHHRVEWEVVPKSEKRRNHFWISLIIGFPFNCILIIASILSKDWWGFANAVSMTVSVFVRAFLLSQNRLGIDKAIEEVERKIKEGGYKAHSKTLVPQLKPQQIDEEKALKVEENKLEERNPQLSNPNIRSAHIKDPMYKATTLLITDDSKVVTMKIPASLIAPVFARNPEVPMPSAYKFARSVGWCAFAVQVISIGMSNLFIQIGTVTLLIISSVLIVLKFGCEDSTLWRSTARLWRHTEQDTKYDKINGISCLIGSRLKATCTEFYGDLQARSITEWKEEKNELKKSIRRQDLYVWLGLTDAQEKIMKAWDLLPRELSENEFNRTWWADYRGKKEKWGRG